MTHVLYVGPFAQHTGYAQAGHDTLLAMHRAGISIEIQPIIACNTDDLDDRYKELLSFVRGTPGHEKKPMTHVIVHTVPAHAHRFIEGAPKGVKLIAMTTWETSNMSIEFEERLADIFDAVWVPSDFCRESVTHHGKLPIERVCVVPHPFNSAHWRLVERPKQDEIYTFYSVLSWCERKNPIGLIKAYFAEFSNKDNVELLIKGSPCAEDIAAIAASCGVPLDELPLLEFEPKYFDHDDMVDLHWSSNCFVTAARGEGWNLPAFEAAIMGMPIISPCWGGQMEFLKHYGNVQLIRTNLTPAIAPPQTDQTLELGGLSVQAVKQVAPGGITVKQWWGEPDLEELAFHMRRAYDFRLRQSLDSLKVLESSFGYATIGAQIRELL